MHGISFSILLLSTYLCLLPKVFFFLKTVYGWVFKKNSIWQPLLFNWDLDHSYLVSLLTWSDLVLPFYYLFSVCFSLSLPYFLLYAFIWLFEYFLVFDFNILAFYLYLYFFPLLLVVALENIMHITLLVSWDFCNKVPQSG